MKESGLEISIQNDTVSFKYKKQSLILENDFLKHKWRPEDMEYIFYTEKELRQLHRVSGHPSVTALQNVLRRASPDEFRPEVKQTLEEISKACGICERYASRPRRFKLTVGSDDLRFNHFIAVYIMYINGKPVLHVVDEATHFAAATFMKSVSAEETWKCLLRCWIRTYLEPPDHLRVDQGSNFVAKQFRASPRAEGIQLSEPPVECPSTITHVEQYYALLRVSFRKIRDKLSRKTGTDADCLQLAVKSVNDTIGREGLFPTLLVFGSIPISPRRTPAKTQMARARAMDAAMTDVQREQAKRKLAFALKHPVGPKQKEEEAELEKLPSGAPVLVFRQTNKVWEGQFSFVYVDGSTVVIQLPRGRKIFRSNVVKPAPQIPTPVDWSAKPDIQATEQPTCSVWSAAESKPNIHSISEQVLWVMFGVGEHKQMTPNEQYAFAQSKKSELQGLHDRVTFKVVSRSSVPKGTRIYGTQFVDIIKELDGKEVQKSPPVAENFRDKGATSISTRSPTVSRMGQRILAATASCYPEYSSYVRDISQAYIQSVTSLECDVYLKPPPEMKLSDEDVLLALKPLYGIPESGMHWFSTYQNHHVDKLEMQSSRSDPCVLYRHRSQQLCDGVTALQVDDSYGHGS